jgi:hypothetical protein
MTPEQLLLAIVLAALVIALAVGGALEAWCARDAARLRKEHRDFWEREAKR